MNQKLSNEEKSLLKKGLVILTLTTIGLISWYMKPKSVADFKNLHHEYTDGVIIKANYLQGKSNRVHIYEYEVRGVKYEGSIGYLKLNAAEGDSCVVIYEFEHPKRSTIHFMKSKPFIRLQ